MEKPHGFVGRASARHATLLFALLLSAAAWADYPLEVIPLKHQTVDRMLPLLRPFVEKDGTVTGMNGQLIIRTSPQNLAELKKIIDRFDRAPRQLRIAVRQGGAGRFRQRDIGVEGRIPVGDKGSVTIGKPGKEEGLHGRVSDRSRSYSTDEERYVRATEGMPAFIQSGLSVPVISTGVDPWGRYRVEQRYRNVTSGFYVTPWVNGDRVTLEISPFAARPTGTPQTFAVQNMTTRVSGRLGQWIPIGGTAQRRDGSQSNITSYSTGTLSGQQPIEVKVELLEQ